MAFGVDLTVVRQILGQRVFAMTADRYTHVDRKRVAREMERNMPDLPVHRATGTEDSCAILAQQGAEQCGSMRTTPQPTPDCDTMKSGGVAEWLKAPVLKTGRGLVSLVGSNPTPTAFWSSCRSSPLSGLTGAIEGDGIEREGV